MLRIADEYNSLAFYQSNSGIEKKFHVFLFQLLIEKLKKHLYLEIMVCVFWGLE